MGDSPKGSPMPMDLLSRMDQVMMDIDSDLNSIEPVPSVRDSVLSNGSMKSPVDIHRNDSVLRHSILSQDRRSSKNTRNSVIETQFQSEDSIENELGVARRNTKALKMLGVSENEILAKNQKDMIKVYSEASISEVSQEEFELQEIPISSPKALRTLGISEAEKRSSMLKSPEKPPRLSIHQDELADFDWNLPMITGGGSLPMSPSAYRLSGISLLSNGNTSNKPSQLSNKKSFESLRSIGSQYQRVSSPLADHRLSYTALSFDDSKEGHFHSEPNLMHSASVENDLDLVEKLDSPKEPQITSAKAMKLLGVVNQKEPKTKSRSSIFSGKSMMNRMSTFLAQKKPKSSLSESFEAPKVPMKDVKPLTVGILDNDMISCGYLQKLDVNVSSDIPKTFFILSNERLCQFRAHHPNEPVMVEMPIDVATKLKKVDSNRFILEISHMNLEGRITTWFLVCNDENDFHRWHDEILMEIEIHRFSKLSLPEIPIQEKHQELDPETLSQIISMISSKQRQEERNLAPIQSAIAILEAIQKREQGKGR